MSDTVLTAVFSNLAKASEKQQVVGAQELYTRLSGLVVESSAVESDLGALRSDLAEDADARYAAIRDAAAAVGDRGALRAVKWGEKVTTAQRSLVDRYGSKGEALLEEKSIFVCEACGFVFLGDDAPPICPVCKAPSGRFSAVR